MHTAIISKFGVVGAMNEQVVAVALQGAPLAPPLLFALFYPSGFVAALGYAGVFVAILYGLLPAFMVWHGRYIEKKKERFRVFGGKLFLLIVIIGSMGIIYFQIAATKGWLPKL